MFIQYSPIIRTQVFFLGYLYDKLQFYTSYTSVMYCFICLNALKFHILKPYIYIGRMPLTMHICCYHDLFFTKSYFQLNLIAWLLVPC